MKVQITIQTESVPEVFPNARDEEFYKACPYCGQSKIPFKLGVCICGAQVGNIQYVRDPKKLVKRYYSYIGEKTEKLGIAERMYI